MSVGCPQSYMTSCPRTYTNHIPMFINQTAACVVPSMNHRELSLAGCGRGVSVMWPFKWGSFDCVLAPPQRTCSFGGFDLSNRSLHVVNTGSEANVSACKIRRGCEDHKLHSPVTLNRLFSAVFSSFLSFVSSPSSPCSFVHLSLFSLPL